MFEDRTDDRWKKQISTEEELANGAKDLINLDEEADQGADKHIMDQEEGPSESSSDTARVDEPTTAQSTEDEIKSEDKVKTFAEAVKAGQPTEPAEQAAPTQPQSTLPEPTSSEPRVSPYSGLSTPEKRLSFPRMTSSQSNASNLSDLASGSTSPIGESTPEDSKSDKRRKRLSSIKGFVRRISDQGITRSPSLGRKGKNPMGDLDEASAMAGASEEGKDKDKRKRLMKGK